MTDQKKNADSVLRFMTEIWSAGNMATIDELISPEFNFILSFARMNNREEFRNLVLRNRAVFQNLTYHVDDPPGDIVADESKGACFWRMTSKHVGTWRNVPGSNNDVEIKGLTFFKFNEEGEMVEARVENDVIGLMKQINGIKMLYE